jgi:tRNA U38,U39,U40 pseudouridine synthase TruA
MTAPTLPDLSLRQMVRRLVAAMLRVGRGQATVDDIAAALHRRRPAFSGEVAPAADLCLWHVKMAGPNSRSEEKASNDQQDL